MCGFPNYFLLSFPNKLLYCLGAAKWTIARFRPAPFPLHARTIPASCPHCSCFMPASCPHRSRFMPAPFPLHARTFPTSCPHRSSFMPAPFPLHAHTVPASCPHRSRFMPASCPHHSHFMPAPFQLHARSMPHRHDGSLSPVGLCAGLLLTALPWQNLCPECLPQSALGPKPPSLLLPLWVSALPYQASCHLYVCHEDQ